MLELIAAAVLGSHPTTHSGPPTLYLDRGYVRYEAGLYANDTQGAFFNLIEARVLITPDVAVEADVPFIGLGEDDVTEFALGNVGLRALARFMFDDAGTTSVEAGLGLSVGTSEANTRLKLSALDIANAMTGLRRNHQFSANAAAVYLPARVETLYYQDVFVQAEGLIGVIFPTGSPGGSAAVQMSALAGVGKRWTQWEASLNLGVGALLPTADGSSSEAQVALVPKVRVYPDPAFFHKGGLFVEASGNINLDEPHGFGGDDGIVWGLFLQLGYLFPNTF
ncbi:MAG: hypothetical protein AAFZ18_07535 [Myxococcota bacterium]